MPVGPLYVLLGEVSDQVLSQFLDQILCLPGIESHEFFIYFGDYTLGQYIIDKYIFPYGWLLFHFDDSVFSYAEDF